MNKWTPTRFPNANDAMAHALNRVMLMGEESMPRGKPVKELLAQSVTVDMRYPLVTRPTRKLGYRFAPAEAAWILSGRNDKKFFEDLKMPFIWEFSDDGFFYQGAYGPQVIEQLTYVCDVLATDHDTRQALMTIWRPNPRPSRDIPCTISFQFIAREGRLDVVQCMRSSDVWLGYPYDVFNASMLAGYIILLLRDRADKGRSPLCLGYHTMMIGSQHVYEVNWARAHEFIDDGGEVFQCPKFDPFEFESPAHLIDHLHRLAAQDFMGCTARFLTHQLSTVKTE